MPLDLSDTSVRLCAQVVGWYHSHPTFKPNPSEKDIENQENFQALFRDEGTKQEPFVGMIFSPYDVRLPDRESRRETFWVRKGAQGYGEVGPSPMRMRGNRKPIAGAVTEDTKACMRQLVEGNMIQVRAEGRLNDARKTRAFADQFDSLSLPALVAGEGGSDGVVAALH